MQAPKLSKGILAYYDTFAGLIPCEVVRVTSRMDVTVKLNANRGAYKRGEVCNTTASLVIPRACIRVKCGQFRIRYYDIATE
jgi:hypothetical protein